MRAEHDFSSTLDAPRPGASVDSVLVVASTCLCVAIQAHSIPAQERQSKACNSSSASFVVSPPPNQENGTAAETVRVRVVLWKKDCVSSLQLLCTTIALADDGRPALLGFDV